MVVAAPPAGAAAAALWQVPAVPYLVIDIETADADELAILAEQQRMKDSEHNYKPATIAKVRERAALLDAAPVILVGLKTEAGGLLFTWMQTDSKLTNGFPVYVARDEKGMLEALGEFLVRMTSPAETLLVAHGAEFDLKKLRLAYLRHKLQLPSILAPRPREERDAVFCTMRKFSYEFSNDRADGYIKLFEACERAGIADVVNGGIDGSLVPEYYRRKQYREILEHCSWDIQLTEQLFLRMTIQAGGAGQPSGATAPGPAMAPPAAASPAPSAPEASNGPIHPSTAPDAPAGQEEANSKAYEELAQAIDSAVDREQLSDISGTLRARRKEFRLGEFAELWEYWKRKSAFIAASNSRSGAGS